MNERKTCDICHQERKAEEIGKDGSCRDWQQCYLDFRDYDMAEERHKNAGS
jgi:hypothetical protein